MKKVDYFEQYKDPRWQKFRLKILEKDGFKCTQCGDDKSPLNAHHLYYISKRKPWEYPIGCVLTLCDTCHESDHEDPTEVKMWEMMIMATARSTEGRWIGSEIGTHAYQYGAESIEEMADIVGHSVRTDGDYWTEIIGAYHDSVKFHAQKTATEVINEH